MKKYMRLNIFEREEISRSIASSVPIRIIARVLGRSPSSISREIHRSVVDPKYYRAIYSQQRAMRYRHNPQGQRKLDANQALREFVL